MDNSPEAWFKALPPLTKGGLVAIFTTTVLVVLGVLNPMLIILDWTLILGKVHVWRLLSCVLFFGKFSFPFLMQLYFFTSFSSKLERHERFTQRPGDYLFFLLTVILLLCAISLVLAWPTGEPLLGPSLVFAIVYYWSRCEPEARLSFWGFEIKGFQFPFVLMAFTLLMGGGIWGDLQGLAAAHLFYFFHDVVPGEYGRVVLSTPGLLHRLMAKVTAGSGAAQQYRDYAPDRGVRAFGGAGHRLG
jgi:Derlin-2/3